MKTPAWKETQAGKEWEIELSTICVIVHGRIDDPGVWFMTCRGAFDNRTRLVSLTPDGAKREALQRLEETMLLIGVAIKEARNSPR